MLYKGRELNLKRILFTEDELRIGIEKTAEKIRKEYEGKKLLLVCILNGSFIFAADFARILNMPCEITFMRAKSYVGTESTGEVKMLVDTDVDISNYHVLILEDIIDTGITMKALKSKLLERKPLSLKVLTLLNKKERRKNDFVPDTVIFEIPDLFVVGYGLDYDEQYRELPIIGELNHD